jgi:hypothetical protein
VKIIPWWGPGFKKIHFQIHKTKGHIAEDTFCSYRRLTSWPCDRDPFIRPWRTEFYLAETQYFAVSVPVGLHTPPLHDAATSEEPGVPELLSYQAKSWPLRPLMHVNTLSRVSKPPLLTPAHLLSYATTKTTALTLEERWFNGSTLDCYSAGQGLNSAHLQPTANSVNPWLGCHRRCHSTVS